MSIVPRLLHQRRCTKCTAPILDSRSGSYCNSCLAAYKRERRKQGYYQKTPEEQRDISYRSNYGISLEEYELMLFRQGGVCAICGEPEMVVHHHGKPKPLGVDHNHQTGEVRELLCHACNQLVGWAEKDREKIKKMLKYLQKHDQ